MNSSIVKRFITCINVHDSDELYALMTDDHLFIDSQGNEICGNKKAKQVWEAYFQLFPDYDIGISEIYGFDNLIVAFGKAEGTYLHIKSEENENYWCLPIAIKAMVKDFKIQLWQVYADTKIPYVIINRKIS